MVNATTTISFHDESRKITGDRWFIEIICTVHVSVSEDLWKDVSGNDPHLLACIRENIGSKLTYSISRTKNFVDEKEKQALSLEIVKQIEDNLLEYLELPSFKTKLFEKRFQEERLNCLAGKNMEEPPSVADNDDDEPTDFSHLFK